MKDALTLTTEQVEHIARLARLRPAPVEIEAYRRRLTAILEYVALLQTLDVEGIEPMTHPTLDEARANRLAGDDPQPPLPLAAFETNAPAMEGRYLAVPKVLGDADASEGA